MGFALPRGQGLCASFGFREVVLALGAPGVVDLLGISKQGAGGPGVEVFPRAPLTAHGL